MFNLHFVPSFKFVIAVFAWLQTNPATTPSLRPEPFSPESAISPPPNLHGHVMESVGGDLFVFGGFNPDRARDEQNPARGWRGDMDGKCWTRTAPTPTPRTFAASAVLDKRIVVLGGLPAESRRYSTAADTYDPARDRWGKLPDLPVPLSRFGAAVVRGRVYAISGLEGGDDGCKTSSAVYELEPQARGWTRRRDIPHGRHAFATTVLDGRIFVLGGYVDQGEKIVPCNFVESYDPVADTWEIETPLPSPRMWFGAGEHDGKVVVLGSFEDQNPRVYDRSKRQWSTVPVPDIRDQRFGAIVSGDRAIVSGGEVNDGEFLRFIKLDVQKK